MMVKVLPMSILVLIVAGVVLALVVFMIVHIRGGRRLGAILAFSGIAGITAFWFLFARVSVRTTPSVERHRARARVDSRRPAVESTPLVPDGAFLADVYPSERSAAVALAMHSGDRIDLVTNRADTAAITVSGDVELAILEAVAAALEDRLASPGPVSAEPKVMVRVYRSGPPDDSWGGPRAKVDVRVGRQPGGSAGAGSIQITVRSRRAGSVESVRYVEKRWAEDFAAFVNANPGGKWALAVSPTVCLGMAEAKREATRDAAEKLAERLRWYLPDRSRSRGLSRGYVEDRLAGKGEGWLEAAVEAALLGEDAVIVDRFAQRLRSPHAMIFRESLLLDVGGAKFAALADKVLGRLADERSAWWRVVLSIGALAGLICAVYAFLNAATRGYYVWSLRIAALVLVAIGVCIVLLKA